MTPDSSQAKPAVCPTCGSNYRTIRRLGRAAAHNNIPNGYVQGWYRADIGGTIPCPDSWHGDTPEAPAKPATLPKIEVERPRIAEYLRSKGRTMPDDDYSMFEAGWLAAKIYEAEAPANLVSPQEWMRDAAEAIEQIGCYCACHDKSSSCPSCVHCRRESFANAKEEHFRMRVKASDERVVFIEHTIAKHHALGCKATDPKLSGRTTPPTMEVSTAVSVSVEHYTAMSDALTQLERVDYVAAPIRAMSAADFGNLCSSVCSSCRKDGLPQYSAKYDLPTSHGQYRCNAHIFHLLRSGRNLSRDSQCEESAGNVRWYWKLKATDPKLSGPSREGGKET